MSVYQKNTSLYSWFVWNVLGMVEFILASNFPPCQTRLRISLYGRLRGICYTQYMYYKGAYCGFCKDAYCGFVKDAYCGFFKDAYCGFFKGAHSDFNICTRYGIKKKMRISDFKSKSRLRKKSLVVLYSGNGGFRNFSKKIVYKKIAYSWFHVNCDVRKKNCFSPIVW